MTLSKFGLKIAKKFKIVIENFKLDSNDAEYQADSENV